MDFKLLKIVHAMLKLLPVEGFSVCWSKSKQQFSKKIILQMVWILLKRIASFCIRWRKFCQLYNRLKLKRQHLIVQV